MARYIDADALIEKMSDLIAETWGKGLGRSWWSHSVILKDNFIRLIKEAPTADVISKSEVDRIEKAYNARLAKDIETNADFVKYAKAEIAREIFEEIERIFDGKKYVPYPLYEIAELKKKYTEGNDANS